MGRYQQYLEKFIASEIGSATEKELSNISARKILYQYDLTGKFIAEYKSVTAAQKLNKFKISVNEKKTSGGFIWLFKKFDDYIPKDILIAILPKVRLAKEIHQYDLQGKYIQSFKSIGGASRHLNSNIKSLKEGKTSGGFIWLFKKYDDCIPKDALMDILPKVSLAKEIHQYDLYGKYIQSFKSIGSASRHQNFNINSPKQSKTSGGFIWQYEKYDVIPKDLLVNILPNVRLAKEIHQYDLCGKYIQSFKSIGSASRHLNFNINSPKRSKTSGGFIWQYEKYDRIPKDVLMDILPKGGFRRVICQ